VHSILCICSLMQSAYLQSALTILEVSLKYVHGMHLSYWFRTLLILFACCADTVAVLTGCWISCFASAAVKYLQDYGTLVPGLWQGCSIAAIGCHNYATTMPELCHNYARTPWLAVQNSILRHANGKWIQLSVWYLRLKNSLSKTHSNGMIFLRGFSKVS